MPEPPGESAMTPTAPKRYVVRECRTVGAWCFLDHAGPVQFAPDSGLHVGPTLHIGL